MPQLAGNRMKNNEITESRKYWIDFVSYLYTSNREEDVYHFFIPSPDSTANFHHPSLSTPYAYKVPYS